MLCWNSDILCQYSKSMYEDTIMQVPKLRHEIYNKNDDSTIIMNALDII